MRFVAIAVASALLAGCNPGGSIVQEVPQPTLDQAMYNAVFGCSGGISQEVTTNIVATLKPKIIEGGSLDAGFKNELRGIYFNGAEATEQSNVMYARFEACIDREVGRLRELARQGD